ncbi:unnamed protein product [Protopolystoma xenopodis]|uniref:POLO box domain-containing protein n=1 Tax=Protopolystoma xenopodis TaxID=117903 RepID=A0A448WD78_9PLAT|nr:unnamed protein product [Protopolystoma xenopodis]
MAIEKLLSTTLDPIGDHQLSPFPVIVGRRPSFLHTSLSPTNTYLHAPGVSEPILSLAGLPPCLSALLSEVDLRLDNAEVQISHFTQQPARSEAKNLPEVSYATTTEPSRRVLASTGLSERRFDVSPERCRGSNPSPSRQNSASTKLPLPACSVFVEGIGWASVPSAEELQVQFNDGARLLIIYSDSLVRQIRFTPPVAHNGLADPIEECVFAPTDRLPAELHSRLALMPRVVKCLRSSHL